MSRGEGVASVWGGTHARAGTVGAADGFALGVGSDGPATVLVTLSSRLAACPAAPSHATIAPLAALRPAIGAMCAIAPAARLNDEHTRHRP